MIIVYIFLLIGFLICECFADSKESVIVVFIIFLFLFGWVLFLDKAELKQSYDEKYKIEYMKRRAK